MKVFANFLTKKIIFKVSVISLKKNFNVLAPRSRGKNRRFSGQGLIKIYLNSQFFENHSKSAISLHPNGYGPGKAAIIR